MSCILYIVYYIVIYLLTITFILMDCISTYYYLYIDGLYIYLLLLIY